MADSNFGDRSTAFESTMMEAVARELKLEEQSPTGNHKFTFSRTSSNNSVNCSSASSAQNSELVRYDEETSFYLKLIESEDEDSDSTRQNPPSYKDRRRVAHTHAEQKRRDAIKKGYDELQGLVPTCQQSDGIASQKLSKATILQRSIDYIQYLVQQKKKQSEELDSLRKEVMALKIMKANYEHIVKAHQNTPQHGQNQVSDEVKFQVHVMDTLFQSFNASISVANFAELSGCVFSWLEEYCKPQTLRELTLSILRQLNQQLNQ